MSESPPDVTSSLPSYSTTNSLVKWLMSISPRSSNAGHRSILTKPIIALAAIVLLAAVYEETALVSDPRSTADQQKQQTENQQTENQQNKNLLAKIYFRIKRDDCAYRICKDNEENCTVENNNKSANCILDIKSQLKTIISEQKTGCPTKNTASGVISSGGSTTSEKKLAESRAKYICNAIGENCSPEVSTSKTGKNTPPNYRVDLFSLKTCQDKQTASAPASTH